MTGKNRLGVSLFTLCLAGLISGSASGQLAFQLTQDGAAKACIVIPADPQPEESLAAQELQRVIERMSGACLQIAQGPGSTGPQIRIGRVDAWPDAPVGKEMLGDEGCLIEAITDTLWLVGVDAQASQWAVYGLLHELGCRWYMPGEIGEVIPAAATITIDGARRIDRPDFPYRQIWYSWGGPEGGQPRLAEWRRRNRSANRTVMHGHNLTNSMPQEASFEKRPELYTLIKGKRVKSQVCTSNPEVVKLITETINQYYDKNPDALCYSLCPDDNDDFCECEHCVALDTGAWEARRERPVVTDRYVTFLNQVCEGIQKKHPGKMVSMYAYVNHSTPPERTPVSPYIVVFFTSSVYCGGHGIGDAICASRADMRRDLEAWCRVCPNVYIYEYDPIPGNAELPWPLFGSRTREMPLYRELGVKGISMESHCSWATLNPNHWVSVQSLWNADRTLDELLQDYCTGFFNIPGDPNSQPLAQAMFGYFSTLEKALANHAPMIHWGQRDIPDFFTKEVADQCRAYIQKASDIANASTQPGADIVRKRMHMTMLGFRYLDRYLDGRRAAAEGAPFEVIRKAHKDARAVLDEMVATNPDYVEVNACYPELDDAFGEIMAEEYTPELGLVTSWHIIGPFDNAAMKGHDAVFPPETEISLDAEYPGLNGPVRWRAIPPREKGGYVDLTMHMKPKDWGSAYALAWIHADKEQDAFLRLSSNDTVKVWLGGELVWRYDLLRGSQMDSDIVPVHLKAGSTPVLLKISQSAGGWGFIFRITDKNGDLIQGVNVTLDP